MKKIFTFIFISLFYSSIFAQLEAGDISIIGISCDTPDDFTFVTLIDIPAGTEINFTDNGVLANGDLRGGEGTITFTAPPEGLSSGIVISQLGNQSYFNGSLNGLSSGGDQVIAYTGDASSPTYIAAAQTNSTEWQTGSDDSNQSDLPPGLTDGLTAVAVGNGPGAESEIDNSEYTGIRTFDGKTKMEMLQELNNAANWTGNNANFDLNTSNFAGVLPVEFIKFFISLNRGSAQLTWSTASEINNSHFNIQYSNDGDDYETIGRVDGNGNSNKLNSYEFVHNSPVVGINYYRLEQIDFDGKSALSDIVFTTIKTKKTGKYIKSNLISNQIDIELEGEAQFVLRALNGQLLINRALNNNSTIDVSNLQSGMYIAQIIVDGVVTTERLIK